MREMKGEIKRERERDKNHECEILRAWLRERLNEITSSQEKTSRYIERSKDGLYTRLNEMRSRRNRERGREI